MTEQPHDATSRVPTEIGADRARQGTAPGIVRYVLWVSLVLVVVGLGLAWGLA